MTNRLVAIRNTPFDHFETVKPPELFFRKKVRLSVYESAKSVEIDNLKAINAHLWTFLLENDKQCLLATVCRAF